MIGFEAAGVPVVLDEDTLREEVSDPAALLGWCESHPEDPRTVAYLRMLGRLDEAAAAARATLAPGNLPPLVRAVRRTRYAQVLQFQGAHAAAEEQYDLAAEETGLEDPTAPAGLTVLAAVFHHRAKARFERAGAETAQERPRAAARLKEQALEDAERALAIRRHLHGEDSAEIASSRQAVERIRRD